MSKKDKTLTTATGTPIADNQNSLTAGSRGPTLLQDTWLLEKLAHFDRERIPERVVHAKGSAAFGHLTITHDITKYSKADIFAHVGKKTRAFLRFSTVAGERGAADAERDVRGFALKLYTQQGNWDIVGNNTPVFFIRDAIKFPDFIHTQKRDPHTNLRNNIAAWDFWSLNPESLHQITILMSDRGIPRSYREMHGFGSHTYSFINAKNERFWVKFHFKSMQGIHNLSNKEAAEIIANDRESHQRDLFENIQKGNFPKWRFCIQIMSEKQANEVNFNPFDLTKIWRHKDFPLIDVGILELNENPKNYFAEVEQAAFNPANIVPGVGYSPDKVLQGRLFAYGDTQRYRLGVNHTQLPVNAPLSPVANTQRDGFMQRGEFGAARNYNPSNFDGYIESKDASEPPLYVKDGAEMTRYDHRADTDYYSQAGDLYRLMNDSQKEILCQNIKEAMQGVPLEIIKRQIEHFKKADSNYGNRIAQLLGV
ncbi:catalase [Helicobacter saguini]|uniref:Catalase n=1 Tax=Helicobacter saguini TaxID=1548018 RepID=A0A347VRT6_9HELI|nr:catalase [Helicobacter saguini]MWV62781.1 catalase [Helicobacter saguini]MWV66549.1 catalase [Helicobacter saguini]MWV68899.1 catalase [Helicobacter saguini]MWV71547.1 catalase [Helicobacter saguini]TLD93642.1 catalase [Helicobacter saguini]